MGQLYVTSSLGGYFALPTLSKEVRHQAQPMSRFRQFTDIVDKDYAGAKKGETFNWDIVSNVATAGGTLVETSTIPRTNFVITQGTGTITEYGKLIAALFSLFVDKFCPKVFGFNVACFA